MQKHKFKRAWLIGRLFISLKLENELSWVEGKRGDRRYHYLHIGHDIRHTKEGHEVLIGTLTALWISISIGIFPRGAAKELSDGLINENKRLPSAD
jgi:hypothetical protein